MPLHFRRGIIGMCLALVAVAAITVRAFAGSGCCVHCGREENCQKVCRLVCEDKKITTTCWGFKSEDFCVPGPSQRGCTHCETVCDECPGPKGPCVQPQKLVWTEWMPGSSAKVYTKKKLMKRTVTKTVPSYRWVVEDVCSQCQLESAARR